MNVNANSAQANGARRRARGQNRVRRRNTTASRTSTVNHSNGNNENNEHHRNEFIVSFQLNILTTSSPILVRNGIEKLGNNCYSTKMIRKYFENSNPHKIDARIVQIWKVHNVGHYAQFMQNNYNEVDNMLLWHGTSRKNLISILQNSLMLPVQATNGHMFGPGIYFADRMSKSANYTDKSGPEVFLLCQVSLGKKWRVYKAENFTSAPGNYNTLKAVGKYVPDIGGQEMLGKYCKIPCGKTVIHRDISRISTPLQFNEYIVFEQDRIRIKFIVHCERGSTGSYVTPTIPRSTSALKPISSGITNNQSTTVRRPLTSTINRSISSGVTSNPFAATVATRSSAMTSGQSYTVPSTQFSTISSSGSGSTSYPSYTAPSPRPFASTDGSNISRNLYFSRARSLPYANESSSIFSCCVIL